MPEFNTLVEKTYACCLTEWYLPPPSCLVVVFFAVLTALILFFVCIRRRLVTKLCQEGRLTSKERSTFGIHLGGVIVVLAVVVVIVVELVEGVGICCLLSILAAVAVVGVAIGGSSHLLSYHDSKSGSWHIGMPQGVSWR